MSEETTPAEPESPDVDSQKETPIDPNTVDGLLQFFVYLSTVAGVEFPVTLSVGGLLVSGHVTSKRRYLEDFRDKIKPAISSLSEEYQDFYNELVEAMTTIKEDDVIDSEEKLLKMVQKIKSEDILYIHLRDAKIFTSGNKPIPTQGSFTWRGRINAVDGFTLGVLSVSESQS